MKKLLMLGSSFVGKEIIRKARERGWHTIVTDNLIPEQSPCKLCSDESWMISTADIDELEAKCREESVEAVFAGVSEFNLDRVKILTERLHLPCYIDAAAWNVARNKRMFKQKCMEAGIPVVPEYTVPRPGDEQSWKQIVYPVVVKPVDGNGNAGISICHNREELEQGLLKARAASSNPEIILEKYIEGDETWNYYVFAEGAGQYLYSGGAYKQPGYPTFLYSFATSASCWTGEYLSRMHPVCMEFLRKIGCREGTAWVQCIRDAEGNWYALEMAHRLGANCAGDILEKSMGFNLTDWMLDTALGIRHSRDSLPRQVLLPYAGASYVYFLFADHAGQISRVGGFETLDPSSFQVDMIRGPGDRVRSYQVMAKIAFYAASAEEACQVMQTVNKQIRIDDASGGDLIVRYTDYNHFITACRG